MGFTGSWRPVSRQVSFRRWKSIRCRATLKNNVNCAGDPAEEPERDVLPGENFESRGRFNASLKSVWRALTEYENLYNTSDAIVSCKRIWVSSRVSHVVIRVHSRDNNLLWGSMQAAVTIKIEEDIPRGEIRFQALNENEKNEFSFRGYEFLTLFISNKNLTGYRC